MLSAIALVRQLADGTLRPAELAERLIEVIEREEQGIKAFAHFNADQLRKDVQRVQPGPLNGLPIAFKDIIDTADYPTEYGSAIYRGWRPRADASIVAMARARGGIVLGKAVTTEFAFLEPSVTINPRDASRTPGGSSAGSAAGVAAGLMPLAFGTQTGGSIIRPAAFCSVTAFKPSYNLLPLVGVKPGAWALDTLGLFGAGVDDVAFGLEAVTGRDLRVDNVNPGVPHFAVCDMAFAGPVSDANARLLDRAVRAAEKAGARVTSVTMPDDIIAGHRIHPTIYNFEGSQALAWEIASNGDQLSSILKQNFAPATPIGHAEYDHARGVSKRAREAAKQFFEGFDALLTHSAPLPVPDRTTTGDSKYNRIYTLLGTPCVNVSTPATSGLYDNVQVISGFGRDKQALLAARFLEEAMRRG